MVQEKEKTKKDDEFVTLLLLKTQERSAFSSFSLSQHFLGFLFHLSFFFFFNGLMIGALFSSAPADKSQFPPPSTEYWRNFWLAGWKHTWPKTREKERKKSIKRVTTFFLHCSIVNRRRGGLGRRRLYNDERL